MKILVECSVPDTDEYWCFELEGPEADIQDLKTKVMAQLELLAEEVDIPVEKIKIEIRELPGTIH